MAHTLGLLALIGLAIAVTAVVVLVSSSPAAERRLSDGLETHRSFASMRSPTQSASNSGI
jgi:hypothetical protein